MDLDVERSDPKGRWVSGIPYWSAGIRSRSRLVRPRLPALRAAPPRDTARSDGPTIILLEPPNAVPLP